MKLLNPIEAWDYYKNNSKWVRIEDDIRFEGVTFSNLTKRYDDYIDFLKQPPHPSMFVPWDKENNCPMEKPDITKGRTVKEGYVNKYIKHITSIPYV